MPKNLTVIESLAALFAFASPSFAQSPNWVKVGGLGCTMAPTIGLLVVSEQKLNCKFTPDGSYPAENYTGTMGSALTSALSAVVCWPGPYTCRRRGRHKARSPALMAGRAVVLLQEWVSARTFF